VIFAARSNALTLVNFPASFFGSESIFVHV
jgi:hypothetical protein